MDDDNKESMDYVLGIVKKYNMFMIKDKDILNQFVSEVIENNPSAVSQYKSGNVKIFGFFVGQVMKCTRDRGQIDIINELLLQKLETPSNEPEKTI